VVYVHTGIVAHERVALRRFTGWLRVQLIGLSASPCNKRWRNGCRERPTDRRPSPAPGGILRTRSCRASTLIALSTVTALALGACSSGGEAGTTKSGVPLVQAGTLVACTQLPLQMSAD
jgi:hypothetical protein